jgi:hypothetical protein
MFIFAKGSPNALQGRIGTWNSPKQDLTTKMLRLKTSAAAGGKPVRACQLGAAVS